MNNKWGNNILYCYWIDYYLNIFQMFQKHVKNAFYFIFHYVDGKSPFLKSKIFNARI